ncbi:MAG TPA: amidohydrolase family protein, partial [Puia sp.]|nr:amidohydrolase family protein [Puia sp.]
MRDSRHYPRGQSLLIPLLVCLSFLSTAQTTHPVNDVADPRERCYAFTHATIVKDDNSKIADATLLVRDGLIVSVGAGAAIPKDAVVIDCTGKYIYPSFIDLYSDYGMPVPERGAGRPAFDFRAPSQFNSNTKGAYDWNQAIHPETDASRLFVADEAHAKPLRDAGFGTVLSHVNDGIARGTGVAVTLTDESENMAVVKQRASANYSLNKGTSTQNYPSSLMGSIALLRQTYLDGQWYKTQPKHEGTNLSLEAWNSEQSLPQIFEGGDKWQDLHGDRIGKEFGVQYIIKGGENEYQRIADIAATRASFIVPVNFPQAMDVGDPDKARFVSLADMKHWELAPTNPGAFEKAGINFCLTAADLRDPKDFLPNLRKAMEYGLSEGKALEALTKTPAMLIGIYDKVGSLDAGKLANFLITNGPVFSEKTSILENWVHGKRFDVKAQDWKDIRGVYDLVITSTDGSAQNLALEVKSDNSASVIGKDTMNARFSFDGKLISLSYGGASGAARGMGPHGANPGAARPEENAGGRRSGGGSRGAATDLSGVVNDNIWNGNGTDSAGNPVIWTATFSRALPADTSGTAHRRPGGLGKILYPFDGYGWDTLPVEHDILIKNATVWTNEAEGHLPNTDVLLHNGKIA